MNDAVSQNVRVAGIMGWPVHHSLSPRIHGHWIRRHGIDGFYVPLPVAPAGLRTALQALPALGFVGCNITIPHKIGVMEWLDEISETARTVGAVNTVFVRDGRLLGENTDAAGFLDGLESVVPDWASRPGTAVVIGAGGAARAVVAAICSASSREIVVVNRTRKRTEELCLRFPPARAADFEELPQFLAETSLLVNASSLGMEGFPPLDIDLTPLASHAVVADIVYVPIETSLLHAARQQELPAVDGLAMLLGQAVSGFEGWFGVRPKVDEELRQLMRKALEER